MGPSIIYHELPALLVNCRQTSGTPIADTLALHELQDSLLHFLFPLVGLGSAEDLPIDILGQGRHWKKT